MTWLLTTQASIILCVLFALIYSLFSSFKRTPTTGDILIVSIQPIAIINNTNLLFKAIEGFKCDITYMDTTFIVIGIIAIYILSLGELITKIKPLIKKE